MGFFENPQIGSLVAFRSFENGSSKYAHSIRIVLNVCNDMCNKNVLIYWCSLHEEIRLWSKLDVGAFNRYLQVISQ